MRFGARPPAGEETLAIIEVQAGTYLGEDDIVRFEDR
jgi:mannose-6-phosphate isomerase-like protein (cupin superfamily)